ncbi:hypothetical protein BC629DRAFT_1456501 [Irpex lacteus]|nr:hypothetical protein BC629DRAFT_1456501 [Irpex lacteus]
MQIRPYEINLDDISDTVSGPLRWAKDSDRDSLSKNAYDYNYAMPEDEEPGLHAFPPHPRIRRSTSGRKSPWMLDDMQPDPYKDRLTREYTVLFQLLFSSTLILAAISTLVDLGAGRSTPTRVGTQHVALMLVTWLPAMVLGVAALRRYLRGDART